MNLEQSGIACKRFQRVHPGPFLTSFQICSLGKGNQAFGDKRFYLDRSGIDCKMFQRGHPEPILTIFRFFTRSTIGQTLTFIGPSFRPNQFI